ncbi:hypothetical protein CALVIDRAFT_339488 [Calocera viscosa TUFC12733]|uniref:Carbohydrate-binding module family 52 protein n=1 Tax=Calocera viscosa (strain TUFC12733) TaxID=1330018 RepID=A0A167HHA4_CALVF|nr:hypothetical protein CALVIDRAFT_339488 [Calocera viscosa TUFC12733]
MTRSFLLLALITLAAAQRCTKPGYGTDPVCSHGSDPYCDGSQCLYQSCTKGFYASQVQEEGIIFDSETANLCSPCPGEGQTTDVSQGGLTYGIGECYIPCGPVRAPFFNMIDSKAKYCIHAGKMLRPFLGRAFPHSRPDGFHAVRQQPERHLRGDVHRGRVRPFPLPFTPSRELTPLLFSNRGADPSPSPMLTPSAPSATRHGSRSGPHPRARRCPPGTSRRPR